MATKKKLVIATDNFIPRWDGIARFLIELIPELTPTFDITILAPRFPGKIPSLPVKVVFFEIRNYSVGDFQPAKPRIKTIEHEIKNADLVWVQTIGPIGYNTLNIANKFKKPVAAFTHSIEWELVPNSVSMPLFKKPLHTLTKKTAKSIYNKADVIFSPSEETAEKFSILGVKVKKKIITLGIDVKRFVPPKNKDESKEDIDIAKDKFVIGYTGRLAREKDLKTLYRAFLRLQKIHQNCVLLIVGDGLDSIKNMFRDKENIILTGPKDDVVPYLQAMDCYVLPSLTETTSLSTLEAMSCGLVVFATRVGFIKNYIKEGDNGFLFPKKNAYLLSKKMELAIKDEKLRERVGKKARHTVETRFRFEDTAEKIRKELVELTKEN